MAMGAADVVPGVSGGTIAFISGIYEELINTLNGLNFSLIATWRNEGFVAFWEKLNGTFLLCLISGIAISVISLARGISWLLENKPVLLWAFFFGLVVASIFVVARSITRWTAGTLLIFIIGAVLAWYITGLPPTANTSGLAFLFLSGALAICAMILPGISGAFILVLLGSYKTVLDAVHERDMLVICTVALGAVFGLLSFSRLLKWMFSRYNNITLALLTGFILGSLKKIWPWKVVLETRNYGEKIIAVQEENVWPWRYNGDPQIIYAIVLVILGFSLIFMLEKLATKK
jgi:putative membrane protein